MRRALILATLLGVLAALVAAVAPNAFAVSCPTGWGSGPRDAMGASVARLAAVRDGTSPCYDRVVIDIAGPIPGGYHVAYVAQVRGEATGFVIPTPGGARLQLTVRDPANEPVALPSVAGFPTLRSLRNAGSFEGQTSFGVGVRARLPFRVFTLPGPGTHSRLVLDVAHHW